MSAVRLQRDGVTRTGYLVLGTWGWFLYGFGALLPQLRRDQDISATVAGLHSVLLAVGALVAGVALLPLLRRVRRRGVIRLAASVVIVGCIAFAIGGDSTPVTLAAVLVTGIGGSLLVSSATPVLDDHHSPHGSGHSAAALAEGNALAAGFGLVAPLLVGAGIGLGVGWQPALLLTVPLAVAAIMLAGRQPRGVDALDGEPPGRRGGRAPIPRTFWPLLGALMALVGVEFCMAAWTAELLSTRTGLGAGAAAAGVSAVVAGMTVGRLLTGRVALRRPARPLLAIAVVVTAVGWALTWLATSPVLALLGLAVTGLGMGAHFPLGSALAMGVVPGQRDRASALMSIGVGVAAGAGPFAIGALSDATSTHTAFLVVPALLGVGLALLVGPAVTRRPRNGYRADG